jgi:branched-chain amino acid transport system substrate-binding protein
MPVGSRCLLAWLLLAPLAGGAGPPQVALGLVVPPSEPDSTSLLHGVQLAVSEANEDGQPPVSLDVRSEEGQWGTAGNDAVILVSEGHVDAIIAPSDGATNHLILQVSGRTQVPVASLCSDSSVTDAGVPWAVRVVPRTDQEAESLFTSARRTEGSPFHWWAVVPAGHSGRGVRHDLERAASATATHLDQVLDASDAKTDLASRVRLIVAAAPGGVLMWLPPSQAGTFAAALRSAGYGGRLAGPSPLDAPAFFATAGAAATGVQVTDFRPDAGLHARLGTFEHRFLGRFAVKPDFSAAAAYDAARVLIETLRRAEKGAGNRQFPLALPTDGVTGILHFDKSGNRTDALQVLTCQDGRFVPLPPSEQQP